MFDLCKRGRIEGSKLQLAEGSKFGPGENDLIMIGLFLIYID
jgi:hypothetical protein